MRDFTKNSNFNKINHKNKSFNSCITNDTSKYIQKRIIELK